MPSRQNLARFQAILPDDVKVSYQFDESPIVYRAIESVGVEGALGAGLTGLMVLLFLRDLRAVIIVVLNIPLALLGSIVLLDLTGNSINIMTLGGLALAIGILVDEATVEIENIHTQMEHTPSMSRAVRQGNMETAVPRLLALLVHPLGVHPVVHHDGGGARAVRAAVAGRRRGDDHVVPALQHVRAGHERLAAGEPPRDARPRPGRRQRRRSSESRPGFFVRMQERYGGLVTWTVAHRKKVVLVYLLATGAIIVAVGLQLGRELFPRVNTGQFQLRDPAAAGDPLRADDQGRAQDAGCHRRGGRAEER